MRDKIKATSNISEFTRALRDYVVEGRLDVSEAMNKKAGDVAFSASKDLPGSVTVKASITSSHPKGSSLWHALATGKTKFGVSKKGAAVRGQGNKKIADAIYASRLRHVSYSRALFLRLAQDMGKKVTRLRKSGAIQNTDAVKAKVSGAFDNPAAILRILGVEESHQDILSAAIRTAVAVQIKDMRTYINRKLAQRAKAHSGRKV